MACYSPLKGFIKDIKDNGKKDLFITSYKTDHIELYTDNKWRPCELPIISPYAKRCVRNFIEIPCGKCIGCQLDYSRMWADRCMLELQEHDSAYFLTLTYDDDHLNLVHVVDNDSGEIKTASTLMRSDVQKFLKRLRKRTGQKIRYYGCGEYGASFRPHYHIIVFGLVLDDLIFYKKQSDYYLYNSPLLEKIWKNGFVVVGRVTYETCAYTARYVTKKVYGNDAREITDLGFEKQFSFMSLKPAIGKVFFDNHPEIVTDGFVNLSTENGGKKVYSCRYFNDKFDLINPEEYAKIKEKRKYFAEQKTKGKLFTTSNDYLNMLESEALNKERQIKVLGRSEL